MSYTLVIVSEHTPAMTSSTLCFSKSRYRTRDGPDRRPIFIARTDDTAAFLCKMGEVRRRVMGLTKLLGGKADILRGFTRRYNEGFSVTPYIYTW
jgi:Mg2+ and Co2+ transporter CorA